MKLGAAYYPEHWSKKYWQNDIKMMLDCGFNTVRLGEFSWCLMEPEIDVFDFSWLLEAVEMFHSHNISVLLGTPTAGPPAWLINTEKTGQNCLMYYENSGKWQFGGRSLCCINHPFFIERSNIIAEKIAETFAHTPGIIGFQIDNEIGMYGTRCYCEYCQQKFRNFLKEKYTTIENINEALGMTFGSAKFRTFDDIEIPRISQDLHNPGLILESQRFFSKSNIAYVNMQADAIRKHSPDKPITTNVCHMLNGWTGINEHSLFQNLDVAGWDCYPVQFNQDTAIETTGLLHAMTRSYKQKKYWMLEQQSGSPFGMPEGDPRKISLWTWQAIAHGAEMIVYFRWRTCRFGGEQYWRGILDHDKRKHSRYQTIKRLGKQLTELTPLVDSLTYSSKIAILADFDSCESFFLNPNGGRFDYRGHITEIYTALNRVYGSVDIIYNCDKLTNYKMLVVPAMRLMTHNTSDAMKRFTENGGILICTAPCAELDENHVAPETPVPWLLNDLLGIERITWSVMSGPTSPPKERIGEDAENWKSKNESDLISIVAGKTLGNNHYRTGSWCETIQLTTAETLATYAGQDLFTGQAAVTVNKFAKGKAVYVAASTDRQFFIDLFSLLLPGNKKMPKTNSEQVEIVSCFSGSNQRETFFILNHSGQEKTINLPGSFCDLIANQNIKSEIILQAYETAIIACSD